MSDSSRPETTSAQAVIEQLRLEPHPEGGWFRQTFRDGDDEGAASTAIYYLLARGERSHWHRVTNAAEVWHHYAGDPLTLSVSSDGLTSHRHVLGSNVFAHEEPQVVVPQGEWQSAASLGDWSLVGCTVAPGFEFAAFEMAPPGWEPGG